MTDTDDRCDTCGCIIDGFDTDALQVGHYLWCSEACALLWLHRRRAPAK